MPYRSQSVIKHVPTLVYNLGQTFGVLFLASLLVFAETKNDYFCFWVVSRRNDMSCGRCVVDSEHAKN